MKLSCKTLTQLWNWRKRITANECFLGLYLCMDSNPNSCRNGVVNRVFGYRGYQMGNQIITLDNCEQWFYQQPERLTFIELNFQDDQRILCELEKAKTTSEQWNKTVDKFVNREIHRMEFENVNGKCHAWVYFREGK